MNKFFFILLTNSSALIFSQQGNVGLNTTTPQKTMHINGSLQITNEFNVGGNSTTAGNAGNLGQILTSQGSNLPPVWNNLSSTKGILSNTLYYQGTASKVINSGITSDVPGLTFSYTVPTNVSSQTLVMTFVGYARKSPTSSGSGQGVFSINQNGVKISSAYVSVATGDGSPTPLVNLPVPCTMIKTITLNPGTYNFTINFTSWAGNLQVNAVPSDYAGYDSDTEALLSKLNILVYNN